MVDVDREGPVVLGDFPPGEPVAQQRPVERLRPAIEDQQYLVADREPVERLHGQLERLGWRERSAIDGYGHEGSPGIPVANASGTPVSALRDGRRSVRHSYTAGRARRIDLNQARDRLLGG